MLTPNMLKYYVVIPADKNATGQKLYHTGIGWNTDKQLALDYTIAEAETAKGNLEYFHNVTNAEIERIN